MAETPEAAEFAAARLRPHCAAVRVRPRRCRRAGVVVRWYVVEFERLPGRPGLTGLKTPS